MPGIWRRQPSRRLSSYNLTKKEDSSQSTAIALESFEMAGGAIENGIVELHGLDIQMQMTL
jgi:hypothetical protein